MKFSMYMASANRLGIPHEMMTVINLGRRSSAPLQKEKSVTCIIAFCTVFNLQSNVFNFASTFQYRGSACKKEHSFPKYRVRIKCGYHLRSEPECATGIFNLWLSKVNKYTENSKLHYIPLHRLFHWKSEYFTAKSWHPCFLRNKAYDYSFVCSMHKYQEWRTVSAWQIIIHSKTLLIQNQVIWNTM